MMVCTVLQVHEWRLGETEGLAQGHSAEGGPQRWPPLSGGGHPWLPVLGQPVSRLPRWGEQFTPGLAPRSQQPPVWERNTSKEPGPPGPRGRWETSRWVLSEPQFLSRTQRGCRMSSSPRRPGPIQARDRKGKGQVRADGKARGGGGARLMTAAGDGEMLAPRAEGSRGEPGAGPLPARPENDPEQSWAGSGCLSGRTRCSLGGGGVPALWESGQHFEWVDAHCRGWLLGQGRYYY